MIEEAYYGLPGLPILLRTGCLAIKTRWDAFFGSVSLSGTDAAPAMSVDLTVGGKVGGTLSELKVVPPAMSWEGGNQWCREGAVLTEFRFGAGWVGHDFSRRCVEGAITREAVKDPKLVHVLVFWALRHTLSVFRSMLPTSLAVLHSSAVSGNGQGLLVLGTAGSGKTTICLSLLERGFTLLSDDHTIIDISEGAPRVVPFPLLAHVGVMTRQFVPRLAERLTGRVDESGEVIVPGKEVVEAYGPPPKSPVRLSILALSEACPGEPTRVQKLSRPRALAQALAQPDPFNEYNHSARFDALLNVVRSADHVVSISSGINLPEALESAFERLVATPRADP